MKNIISTIIAIVLLFNLGYKVSGSMVIANHKDNNVEPFMDFYERFISAFNEKNITELNKCINSEYGLFVLDNPGAFSVASHFNSFSDIMGIDGESDIGNLKALKVNCKLQEGKPPIYDCELDKWNKQGCFLDKNSSLSISEYYKIMLEYNLADINSIKTEMALSEKSGPYISHQVYSTKGDIGFYFGIIDNNWCLICINKITPCSA